MFCPSGTLENRTFDRERTGTYSQRSRKGRTQTRDPGWRMLTSWRSHLREASTRYRRLSSGSSASPSMVTPGRSPGPSRCAGSLAEPGPDWPLLVWPSLAKQLPPGTTIAPLTWQRNRHGSQKPPGPFYEARFVGAGPARERERSSRQDAREIANGGTNSVSGIPPAGFAGLSLARQAPTKPHSIERFGASDNPGPWRTGRSTGSVQGRIHSVPGRA